MELMQSVLPLKSSSFSKSPSLPTAYSSGHGSVEGFKAREWKTIRMNPLRSRKLNCPENAYKNVLESQPPKQQKTKCLAGNGSSELSGDVHDTVGFRPQANGRSLRATWNVIYNYSRVYTLKGTAISIISISLLAIHNLSDITPSFYLGVFQALLGGCLANLYVVGINQLSDIEIDKVNKPHLPLASGELPVKTGVLLTSLYAILGFCLGWIVKSWPLKLGLFLWYAFGTAYSVNLPLLRWKRIPMLAAICLWSVQGAIVPILFHLHAQTCIQGRTLLLSKHAIFVSAIMSVYAVVIALFKDVPDVEGDKINGINSLASQVGKKRVFWICVWLLEIVYSMAVLIGLSSTRFWIRSLMVIGHSILGFVLWRIANLVDLESNEAIESFYLFIWKLYYLEYLFVPILRF